MCDASVTPWTVAYQVPLCLGFPRQEHWSFQSPFPSPEDLSDPGIQPESLVFPALAGGFFTPESPEGLGGTKIHINRVNHLKHNESSTKGVVWGWGRGGF